jgi:hypothetical protein
VQAFDTACAGVPLPVPDDADALLARCLVPLLFADDFNALADEPQVLHSGGGCHPMACMVLQVAHESQCGPKQECDDAVRRPQCASQPLQHGDVMWGGEPLPVVDKYKYLGVMLGSDCTWHAHVEHVVAKATQASYAMGSVLHNRKLDTEICRVVRLAKLRPVLEYCSTVWHAATAAERSQLEGVVITQGPEALPGSV